MSLDKPSEKWGQRAGLWVAALITLWIASLHVLNLCDAGPLWRDEAGTVSFAAMPTVGEIWHNLRYDNFPPLFVAVARIWTLAGLSSDFSYRLLGFLIGMGTLGVLWWCARQMGGKTPLLALALYAANPEAIRVGDALRPYGLGIALNLLTLTLIWNFVQTPGRRALIWATLAATLSVQCLYQNAFFIIAFSCGAWVVTIGRSDWKTAWQMGIIGLVAALSLLPYCVIIKEGQQWLGIPGSKVYFDAIWQSLYKALQASGGRMASVWLALWVAGLAVAVLCGKRQRRWDRVYCGTVLAASVVFYLGFLWATGRPPRLWYFLVLMAPAALMLDSILGGLDMGCLQMGRAVLSFILVVTCIPAGYAGVRVRQSNVDLIAAKLKETAQPEDLILVTTWYYGVSLQRYLDTNRWTTVPPLDDMRIHRYDLVKQAMMAENPIGPVLDKVRTTLSSGHRLWIMGALQAPPGGNPPPVYPPYNGGMEDAEREYMDSWVFQIGYMLEKHGIEANIVDVPIPGGLAVNAFESVPLVVFHGWRE